MQQPHGHINPAAHRLGRQPDPQEQLPRIHLSLGDMTSLTIRLAHVLAEEVDCLQDMRIKDMEPLQEEKNRLVRVIGLMKKEMERTPDFLESCAPEDVECFRQVMPIFERVLEENHRRLLVAKEVNSSVVQAISEAVREETQRKGYDRKGKNGAGQGRTPSVSLNETI